MVRRLAWFLTLAGAVPFVLATGALFASDASSVRVPAITALVTYSAVILSFLGGIEWGLAIRDDAGNEASRAIALGLSTVSSLAAWAVLWLPSATWQVGRRAGPLRRRVGRRPVDGEPRAAAGVVRRPAHRDQRAGLRHPRARPLPALAPPHLRALRPGREPAKRSSHAKNSRYQRREFCGLRIQWFSSGKNTSRAGTPFALRVL